MNFVQIVATLRKFGNYLAGLFPALVVLLNWLTKQLQKTVENPVVAPLWGKLSGNRQLQAIWKFFERFFWRTYSKDRLDLTQAPPETVALLRPIFQLSALLCVLIPLTQFTLHPVDIEAFSGFKGSAPAWSVILWIVSLPFAWAALLVGTAISNRLAFMLTACLASSLLFPCVIMLPRDFANLLAPISILLALGFCERSLKRESTASQFLSVTNAIVVGIAAGIPLIALTPIRPYLGTLTTLSGPAVGIGSGAIVGSVLGLLVLVWARLPNKPERLLFFRGAPLRMGAIVWSIVGLLSLYLAAGVFRGSLGQSGSMLISSLYLTYSYLWPVWYFIGVGIIHKLMGSSKIVASSIEGLLPRKLLTPLLVLMLIIALFIANLERLTLGLSLVKNPLAEQLLPGIYQLYLSTKQAIWSNPNNVLTIHWFNWVLLLDVLVVIILAIQKRLTSAAVTRLLFLSSFAALLVWEYAFQLSSFSRAPSHSVLGLFLFATWLLWLMHTVGWGMSSKSSPCWPASGRLAVYSGIAVIALLDIHARSACQDFKVMNEVFLDMFRGVIDFGLPYYFLVWTSKKLDELPVRIPTLLGIFSLGAITSFAFNVLEKLAGAGWNVSQCLRLIEVQKELLNSTGSPNLELDVPTSFFIIRAINYVALMTLLYAIARKRSAATTNGSHTILFILVAYASGVAAFSKSQLFLPIFPEFVPAIAPCVQELMFNCNLLQSYLSYWIPALILGISQLSEKHGLRNFLMVLPVALVTHGLISWGYADFEEVLRASDSLYPIITALTGVFLLLVVYAIEKIKPPSQSTYEKDSSGTLLSPRAVIILLTTIELVLIPVSILKYRELRFDKRQLQVFQHPVLISSSWHESELTAGDKSVVTLTRPAPSGGQSILQIGVVPSDTRGTTELLKTLLAAAEKSKNFPNLTVLKVEPWSKYCPNALACQFSYDLTATNGVRYGLSVLIPSTDEKTEFYTLHTNPGDMEKELFEMAHTIKQIREIQKK